MKKKIIDLVVAEIGELITLRHRIVTPLVGKSLAVDKGVVIDVGDSEEIFSKYDALNRIEAKNKVVMPGFVDSHTHLLFGGSREDEFIGRIIHGKDYMRFLKSGGGILETAKKTMEMERRELFALVSKRLDIFLRNGTTTIEIKSGYGLSAAGELALLEAAEFLKKRHDLDIISTFLGAHAWPPDCDRGIYLARILWMLAEPKYKNKARYCDVFCEKDVFELNTARRILRKAKDEGWSIKLHAGEFNDIGGVELGLQLGAISVDHCDHISDWAIQKLADSKTFAVLLPVAPYHLMTGQYAPARKMIDAGVKVALGTDFNPGSAPCMSMQVVIGLACRQMRMTPEEAIIAATINAARAIGMGKKVGSLEIGKQADIIVLGIPTYRQLPYWIGENLVETVIKKGKIVVGN